MSYKVYKSQNYFVVHDTTTNEDVIRQVRNLVRWEKKGTLYSFYYNTPNLTTSGNAIVRLGSVYEFSDLVDSTGTAWTSQSSLDLYLEQWTGHICCPTTGEDALYNLYNSVPTLLSTGAIPSGSTSDISAPDGTINIKKTGDGTITSIDIPSGSTVNYNVADNNITVNSGNSFTIDATDPLDIVLKDSLGSTLTPNSVTPHAGTHHVDIVLPASATIPVGAKLMKTGQTTSYATNDDGDLEIGRLVNFTTLNSNNPFGNTNRFTSELGTQTFTNGIIIDWSTYDGSTVLGWYKGSFPLETWANALTNATALSVGGFNTWRIPNAGEAFSILNYGASTAWNYSPFSITSLSVVWTSTSYPSSTSSAIVSWSDHRIDARGKTSTSYSFRCRTFTVTGTTLS